MTYTPMLPQGPEKPEVPRTPATSKKPKGKSKKKKASPRPTKRREKSRKPAMAARADRHALYQRSVQEVEAEIDFVDDTFKDLRGRRASILREDFCGTANTSCEWVRRRRTNHAIGVDIDGGTLEWGRTHNVAKLPAGARERVTLIEGDVRTPRTSGPAEAPDVVLAMNFSYFVFEQRAMMRAYFASVRESLADGGLFILDCYGGSEAFDEGLEPRKIDKDLTYIWEQADYDPISGHMTCHIHFRFSDGSKMNRAFSYEWRLWTLPEIREILEEAGFTRSTVYWEGTDEETEEGDGNFTPAIRGEADPSWICYIVAER